LCYIFLHNLIRLAGSIDYSGTGASEIVRILYTKESSIKLIISLHGLDDALFLMYTVVYDAMTLMIQNKFNEARKKHQVRCCNSMDDKCAKIILI